MLGGARRSSAEERDRIERERREQEAAERARAEAVKGALAMLKDAASLADAAAADPAVDFAANPFSGAVSELASEAAQADARDADAVGAARQRMNDAAQRLDALGLGAPLTGRDAATLRARMAWLAPLCLARGYSLSDRLHIHLSGDTRGT